MSSIFLYFVYNSARNNAAVINVSILANSLRSVMILFSIISHPFKIISDFRKVVMLFFQKQAHVSEARLL